ncbi:MAG: hypothetical protein ABIJ56_02615, partial [Pseudomonadota bacterium]
ATLIIHPSAPKKSKKAPAPVEHKVFLVKWGKQGQYLFDNAAWLKTEKAGLMDEHAGLTKVEWAYYESKDKNCGKIFEQGPAGKPGPGQAGSDLYAKQLASEEEFNSHFTPCSPGIDWKKHRLLQVSVRDMINTDGFKVNSVKKKANEIIVFVGGHHYCAGAALPASWSAWILVPAGGETVIVDRDMTSYKGPCLLP